MERLPASSKKSNLKKSLLMLWRYLWLGFSIILECAMAGVCILGFFYFRKWNDKLMILAFAVMFIWWFVITFASLVRTKNEEKWVLLTQLWMKLVLFLGAMTFFYLFAPVFAGAFWMAVLTGVTILLTFFIRHEFSDTTPVNRYIPMGFLYYSEGKTEWLSAYYLWLAERSLFSEKFYERIGEEFAERLKEQKTTPGEMFEAADGHITEVDMSVLIYDFTRAYFCFGTAESLSLVSYLGSYEDLCDRVLLKKNMDQNSPFDREVYETLALQLDEVFELYKISSEQVNVIDQKTKKPMKPSRVIRDGNREIDVYAHPLVEDHYLKACLEDFKAVSGELQRIFADDEADNDEVTSEKTKTSEVSGEGTRIPPESLLFDKIKVFPPHSEETVFVITGRKRKDHSEKLAFIIRSGKLFRSGEESNPDLTISPWVLIKRGPGIKG
ncbi:MAG: hypothetical protein J5825_05780 [Lachnospiraceae bacterium]|nr:hypothetical protein [Lachnospiraceae bacterium]